MTSWRRRANSRRSRNAAATPSRLTAIASIGAALVPELTGGGNHVVGLARSQASADALAATGAAAHRGDLDDLDGLHAAAAASDGVIHLAFKHDEAFSGSFEAAADADRRAIE